MTSQWQVTWTLPRRRTGLFNATTGLEYFETLQSTVGHATSASEVNQDDQQERRWCQCQWLWSPFTGSQWILLVHYQRPGMQIGSYSQSVTMLCHFDTLISTVLLWVHSNTLLCSTIIRLVVCDSTMQVSTTWSCSSNNVLLCFVCVNKLQLCLPF